MIGPYLRSGRLILPALLAAALVVACGGEPERPAAGTAAREASDAGSSLVDVPPAGMDGPEVGASPETGSTEDQGAGPTADREPRSAGSTGSASDASSAAGSEASTPAGSRTVSTDAILRATARAYATTRSLRAEFEQQIRNPLLGRTTQSSGTLYQRQPDRFLMEFSDPAGDVIVSDGEYFWLYYPSVDERQVIRAPRGPQGLDLHAQFIGDPVSRFDATSHGTESVRGRTAHVVTLVPRQPAGYRSLKVWIDADDHLVRRFELTEENGAVRRFELSDLVVNPSLPDRLFEFTPPPGTQVIQR